MCRRPFLDDEKSLGPAHQVGIAIRMSPPGQIAQQAPPIRRGDVFTDALGNVAVTGVHGCFFLLSNEPRG